MPPSSVGVDPQPVIELREASKRLSAGVKEVKTAFTNLSLTVNRGDRLGLFGVNGYESTTLLDCLCGVDQLDAGAMEQYASVSWPVGSNEAFSSKLSGFSNARFAAEIYSQPGCIEGDLRFIQELACLPDVVFHKPISTWEGSQKNLLKLAVSLAFEFDVLAVGKINAWDFRSVEPESLRIRELFERRIEGRTMVMAAAGQNKLALEYCDEGLALVDGVLVYRGDPEVCLQLVKEESQRQKNERRDRVNARIQRLIEQGAIEPDDVDSADQAA